MLPLPGRSGLHRPCLYLTLPQSHLDLAGGVTFYCGTLPHNLTGPTPATGPPIIAEVLCCDIFSPGLALDFLGLFLSGQTKLKSLFFLFSPPRAFTNKIQASFL